MIEIKAEAGSHVQVTDKPIYNTMVLGDMVGYKTVLVGGEAMKDEKMKDGNIDDVTTDGGTKDGEVVDVEVVDAEVVDDSPAFVSTLPTEVVEWIRSDEKASVAFTEAMCSLDKVMGKGSDDATWNHVKQVLEDKVLVLPMNKAAFGRFVNAIDPSVSEGSVKAAFWRNNDFFNDSKNGRIEVRCYRLWAESNPDKAICEKVARHFTQVLALRPKM